ncbi:alpha/beta fold hydrolase [Nitrosococcus wardiae]|uniref:Alpha/beta hydrolase n=1 Tax=Nitrosococcus wardiae TaxID=1814290 RepID=A0A4P7C4F4_9GAMM|nr:alpha/beta fold hydrolase [Nitrosococcus wardiae]QBQ55806.1 alpha/beta hydrolase [Nitrosococcus wardiae]
MRDWIITLLIFLFAPYSIPYADTETYGYPISNPYEATIIGTPGPLQADLPDKINIQPLELIVFEDREIPEILWYTKGLEYSLASQEQPAPLVFAISGTGSSANAPGMQILQKALFQAGFHVLSLPSPTHPDFVTSASTNAVPGHIVKDSADLYRVMQLAWNQVRDDIEVTDFYLTGYSLGGAQAAFVSRLDDKKQIFNFKKVLMINPPVNLYNSVSILDKLLANNIPGGMDNLNDFINRVIDRFTEIYRTEQQVEFNDEFLYKAYQKYQPSKETLAAVIGLSFRWAAANMIFVSDVITNSGYVKPKNLKLSLTDSLTNYFKVSLRIGFLDYFNEYLFPFFEARYPDLTRKQLTHSLSLKSIEEYLRESDTIAMVTNEDDPILAPGELEYLREVFQSRAKIYPRGGHLGNMAYKDNVAYMVNFFLN